MHPPLRSFWLAVATIALLSHPLTAQVPQMISYQGRIAVNGVNFDGPGRFGFALVDASGTAVWSNNLLSTGEPVQGVNLTVTKGLYSVLLGDSTLRNMKTIQSSVFIQSDLRLRVWFDDGVNGSQLLTPDQRIAATGYAMIAANVSDGAITGSKIAPGAVGAAQLAPGAVGNSALEAGAAAANLQASGQSAVASGGLILSATENPALVAAGYIRVGTTTIADAWQDRAALPLARQKHTAVWTGTEMIFWGGEAGGVSMTDGWRYNPTTNAWTEVSYEFKRPKQAYRETVDGKGVRPQVVAEDIGTLAQKLLWGTKLRVGVVNLFDRSPPTVLDAFNDSYDTSLYSIRNRYVYVGVNKRF